MPTARLSYGWILRFIPLDMSIETDSR